MVSVLSLLTEDPIVRPVHVRIVDDFDAVLDVVKLILSHISPKITVSTTATYFEQLLRPEAWYSVDVALVDIMLPGPVSGAEILKFLETELPHIRRVAFTTASHMIAARGLNVDFVLPKPFTHHQLMEAINVEG